LVHQRAGNGDTLLLAAGELTRDMVLAAAEPDRSERRAGTRVLLGERQIAVVERQLDVLQRRRTRQQIEVLEDEAEAPVAQRGARVGGQVSDVDAAETVGPARRSVEAPDDVHERRLPRSRGSHDGDEFPHGDVHGHPS
jgi:hypothetical protein